MFTELKAALAIMAVKGFRDRWIRKHYHGGTYFPSYDYSVIIHDGLLCRDPFFSKIWNKLVPLKVSCLVLKNANEGKPC